MPSVLAAEIDTYSLDYTIISDKISVKTTIELSDSIKLIIPNQEFNIVELQYITESLI